MINKQNYIRYIISMMYMAFVNLYIYFGFSSAYSRKLFNIDNFREQYYSGVYQFRFLSVNTIYKLYNFLGKLEFDTSKLNINSIDNNSDPKLFLSFFLYNSFSSVLTIGVVNYYLNNIKVDCSSSKKMLVLLVISSVIGISQFVMVPYDIFSYFILVLFASLMLNYFSSKRKWLVFLFLCLVIIIGTFNRESIALSLAFAAAISFRDKVHFKKNFVLVASLSSVFVITYLIIRKIYNSSITNDGVLLLENFMLVKNILSLFFWIILGIIPMYIANGKTQKNYIITFYIFCLPYIVVCFLTGIIFEIRLFVPIFILAILLSFLNLEKRYSSI